MQCWINQNSNERGKLNEVVVGERQKLKNDTLEGKC
jgi:hypothetical protein